MSANKIKEEGPRDLGKMVRQLSLVAYLMSAGGRKVSPETIRQCVEGYGGDEQNFDAFARLFYRDRDELKSLGIEICKAEDEFGPGDNYWLPRENFFLPPVQFEKEELAALHTCLCLLDGQFAYSRILRLALQSLALGSGNTLEDPVNSCVSVNLGSAGFDAALAEKQDKIEAAVSRRKTILFPYYALSSGRLENRKVDPYSLMLTRGDWYLVGYSHERSGIRIFKLSRIQGKIRFAHKTDHNFARLPHFKIQDYLNREPWQLGESKGCAEIYFSPRLGWWAAQNLSHCGEVKLSEDGSALFSTAYADADPLCSLVLSLGEGAGLRQPKSLEQRLLSLLQKIQEGHQGAVPALGGPVKTPAKRAESAGRKTALTQIEPERFSQLAQSTAYLLDKLGSQESVSLDATEACRDLGFENTASLEQALDMLRLVSVGGGGYLIEAYVEGDLLRVIGWPEGELMKEPVRLSPREARALLLAIDLVGSQLLATRFASLEKARDKIIAAAGGIDPAIPVGAKQKEEWHICRAINRGLVEKRLVEIEFLSQESGRLTQRRVEPYLINNVKGQWYLVAFCRLRQAVRTFRFGMIKSARLLEEELLPREEKSLNLERYRKDPRLPSGVEAPNRAKIWFSPSIARWILEAQSEATLLEDGSAVADIPFFASNWLISEIMKYRGEAVLLSPSGLREEIVATAARLAKGYQHQ